MAPGVVRKLRGAFETAIEDPSTAASLAKKDRYPSRRRHEAGGKHKQEDR